MDHAETLAVSQTTTFNDIQPLRHYVRQTLNTYFSHLDGHAAANLYGMVMEEVEIPLLEAVMQFSKGNQCKAACILGISRGTLRKKLKLYNLE